MILFVCNGPTITCNKPLVPRVQADACMKIKQGLLKAGYNTPLVADIHFAPKIAMQVQAFPPFRGPLLYAPIHPYEPIYLPVYIRKTPHVCP